MNNSLKINTSPISLPENLSIFDLKYNRSDVERTHLWELSKISVVWISEILKYSFFIRLFKSYSCSSWLNGKFSTAKLMIDGRKKKNSDYRGPPQSIIANCPSGLQIYSGCTFTSFFEILSDLPSILHSMLFLSFHFKYFSVYFRNNVNLI